MTDEDLLRAAVDDLSKEVSQLTGEVSALVSAIERAVKVALVRP